MANFPDLMIKRPPASPAAAPRSRPLLPPADAIPSRPAVEKFTLSCVCAKFDKPYELRFERQPSGRLRFVESVKLYGDARANAARPVFQKLSLDEFEDNWGRCAWCGNWQINHCVCGALVCGAREVGDVFHCRDSCGASWVGVPMKEVEAAKQAPRAAGPMKAPDARSVVPAAMGRALIVRK
jgi:hypothetical protein